MDTVREARTQSLKNLRCSNCISIWKENGSKPEEIPKRISVQDLEKGELCPICGKQFKNYYPF